VKQTVDSKPSPRQTDFVMTTPVKAYRPLQPDEIIKPEDECRDESTPWQQVCDFSVGDYPSDYEGFEFRRLEAPAPQKSPPKIYVAAHCPLAASHVASLLTHEGFSITSSWHSKSFLPTEEIDVYTRVEIASECRGEILQSDALVLISSREKVPGGKFIEAGIALGLNKPVITVGPAENLMLHLPGVYFSAADAANTGTILRIALGGQEAPEVPKVAEISFGENQRYRINPDWVNAIPFGFAYPPGWDEDLSTQPSPNEEDDSDAWGDFEGPLDDSEPAEPGEGYRFVDAGETLAAEDEWYNLGTWTETACEGAVLDSDSLKFGRYRRKVEQPLEEVEQPEPNLDEGYRFVRADEWFSTVDECWKKTSRKGDDELSEFHRRLVPYRRKDEEVVEPSTGYHFLTVGELIQPGDEYLAPLGWKPTSLGATNTTIPPACEGLYRRQLCSKLSTPIL
jgi:hypothetical protein